MINDESLACQVCDSELEVKPFTAQSGKMILCGVCAINQERIDKDLAEMRALQSPAEQRVTELANQLVKDLPVTEREYHVKEIKSIVAIEFELKATGIENANFELAKIIEQRINELRVRLFTLKKEEDLTKSAMIADQKYLNILVPKLHEEERANFKNYDIRYQPTKVSPAATARAPRQSASEKALEQGAKLMGLTVAQYQKVMADAISQVLNVQCACKETPGLCKVHVK